MSFGFTRKQIIALAVAVTLIGVAVTVAWSLQRGQEAHGQGYHFTVERDGRVLDTYDLAKIAKLPARTVTVDGKKEEGPALLDLLKASGVDDFNAVEVRGAGIRDDGRIELKRAEVDRDVLLDVAVRGTVKVVGPDIAWDDRVRDVERIVVR